MKKQRAAWIPVVVLLVCAAGALAQTGQQTGTSPGSDSQNIQAYIDSAALGCPAAESRDDGGGDAVERRRRR